MDPHRKYRIRNPGGSGGKLTYEPPAWRFDWLLEKLGTEAEIADKLVFSGFSRVPLNSITGWKRRNRIPPFWLPIFIQMGLNEGVIRDIMELRAR